MAAKRAECSTLAAILFVATSATGQERADLLIAGGTVCHHGRRVNQPEVTPMYDVYSHLACAIKAAHVKNLVIDGRVVVRDRNMMTLDEREVMEKAREIQKRILESLK